MSRTLVLGLTLSLALSAAAHAGTRRCAPIGAAKGDRCECLVRNYGTSTDTGVSVAVSEGSNAPFVNGPTTIDAGRILASAVTVETAFGFCGCEVVGASSSSKVSLNLLPGDSGTAAAVVACD